MDIWPTASPPRRRVNSMGNTARPQLARNPASFSTHDLNRKEREREKEKGREREHPVLRKLQKQSVAASPRRSAGGILTPSAKRSLAFIRPQTSTGIPEPATRSWETLRKPSLDDVLMPSPSSHSTPVLRDNREEITPWEFESQSPTSHPIIEHIPSHYELVDDNPERQAITPWEFVRDIQPAAPPSGRTSTTSSNNTRPGSLNFSDMPLVKRHKSVDRQHPPPRSRSSFLPSRTHRAVSGDLPPSQRPVSSHQYTSQEPIPPLPGDPNSSPARSPFQNISDEHKSKFTTPDRTILKELKHSMDARDSQFERKGTYSFCSSIHHFPDKKHHQFLPEEVPYPRHYERDVLDLDVWETLFVQQMCGSHTFHKFDTPPARVLDLGCGTGVWILNCARNWEQTQFFGLDVVPLQPDLFKVGPVGFANRITWVQHNFLDKLPFPDDEFDFVHIKRIALGVPEHKWDDLFVEITRVMKPGAAFEMIEEDLFFPGKPAEASEDESSDYGDTDTEAISDLDEALPKLDVRHDMQHPDVSQPQGPEQHNLTYGPTIGSQPDEASTPATSIGGFPPTPRSNSPVPMQAIVIAEDEEHDEKTHGTITRKGTSPVYETPSPIQPSSSCGSSSVSDGLSRQTSTSTLHTIHTSYSNLKYVQMPPVATLPKLSMSTSTQSLQTTEGNSGQASPLLLTPSGRADDLLTAKPGVTNMRTLPKPPINPRDHSILEAIYNGMHAHRWVNLAPLSLLGNSITSYFKGVKTHPPLRLTFPPRRSLHASMEKNENPPPLPSQNGSDLEPDVESVEEGEARRRRRSSRAMSNASSVPEAFEADRVITERGLLKHSSPYAGLDDFRSGGLAPVSSTKNSVIPRSFDMPPPIVTAGVEGKRLRSVSSVEKLESPSVRREQEAAMKLKELLPNGVINLDLRTLKLHLHIRVAEILGCAEAMWEWVEQYQKEARVVRRKGSVSQHQPTPKAPTHGMVGPIHQIPEFHSVLADLTREDFNAMLLRFELDMQDQCMLGASLEDWFSWRVIKSEKIVERAEFESACQRWDQWENEQRRMVLLQSPPITVGSSGASSKRHRATKSISSLTTTHEEESVKKSPNPSSASEKLQRTASRKSEKSGRSGGGGLRRTRSRSMSVRSNPIQPLPSTRLSRSLRVFVAWKP